MKALPDGIYVDLSAEAYFAQDRLGSTDLTTLHGDPASWWYKSRHNIDRGERESTPEMDFGSALHLLVLEGEDAFNQGAVISPFEDFRSKEARIWRDQQKLDGKIILKEEDVRRVRHMAALILNHPEFGEALRGGLSEVSVLWTHQSGVKLRARFDKLLPRFVADLKSYGGDVKGRDVKQQCVNLITARHMDVQRFLYFQARSVMAGMVEAGQVYGASPTQAEWLRKVAEIEDWAWVWIFYRRRDDAKGHAPVVQPILRPHFDGTFETGRRKVETAIQNYRSFSSRFGFDTPWAVIEPVWEPQDHDFPPWSVDVAEPVTFHEERAA